METKTPLTIEEIHAVILEIMKDIDQFCRSNDIPYTISAGTMLGAIRHGGFIPWDDDSDLFMLREDFNRFVKTYKSDKYRLLFNTREEDTFMVAGFAKVVDPTTSVDDGSDLKYGIFVDIFPLDDMPEDPKECKKHMHKIMSLHNRLYHRQRKDIVSILKSYRHSLTWWWNKLESTVADKTYKDSPIVAQVVGTNNYRTVIRKDRFETLVDIPFEGYNFLGFSDPHSYLEMLYGPDYMTPKKWNHNITAYRK